MRSQFAATAIVGFAVLGGVASAAQAPTPDPVPLFEQWAAEQGTPVSQTACRVDDTPDADVVTCYGLIGSLADGFDRAVVAVGFSQDGVVTFVPLPFGKPGIASTPPVGSAGGLVTSFGDGTFVVGVDIAPGTYRTADAGSCYWERLSGFSGTLDDIIANDNPTGQAFVEIAATDVAFSSERCGGWTLITP